jgi:hypothetical protein
MQKKISIFFFLLLPLFGLNAQFQVKIKVSNNVDTVAYLRASIFDDKNYIPKDTIRFKNGTASIKNAKSVIGGIYFLYFPATKQKISFIAENKDIINIVIDGKDYINNTSINGLKNKLFLYYQQIEKSFSYLDSNYAKEITNGKKFGQTQKAAFFKAKTDSLTTFRTNALTKMKASDVLYIHFDALNKLDASIPNKKNFEARHKFINQFDLNTPRLFFTPNIKNILIEYFSYYPLQADSMIKGVDTIMSKLLCTGKAYGFVFDYVSKLMKNREIQNNTEGYAYVLNKFVKNGKCAFLEPKQKELFLQELVQIQSQKLKDTCFNMQLPDSAGSNQNLHQFAKKFNYTVIVFFDPNCDHCKTEVPKMDSTIVLLEKQLLVKIGKYAVCNAPASSKNDWIDFINKYQLANNYCHVLLGNDLPIRKAYDAFSNPLFYLIDRDGILLAKKISPNNLRKELVQAFQNFK